MARPRLRDRSQKPQRKASESAISSSALAPMRPIRRRSRTASVRMKPSTIETGGRTASSRGFVLQERAAAQRERAGPQLTHHPGLMGGEEDGRPPDPDVLHEIEDFGA